MIVRALSSTGDWTFGASKDNYLSANAAVAQSIGTRLLSFLGDCFFDTSAGIDWFTFLGGSKSQLALELAISAVILNTENVTGISTLSVGLVDSTRAFSITYSVTTTFGNLSGVVNQNLGLSVTPPVNNLLPQFNQTLLNNVSATAIANAIFSSAVFWEVDLDYYIECRTSTQGFTQRGTLIVKYDPYALVWSITNNVLSGSSGPNTGVTFTVNPTTGQVYYASDNVTGSNYVGNLILEATNAFVAGV